MNQPMTALQRANEVRIKRAALFGGRKDIDPQALAVMLINDLPEELKTMEAYDFLMRRRRWGSDHARKCLSKLLISEVRHLGDLTQRQRNALANKISPGILVEQPSIGTGGGLPAAQPGPIGEDVGHVPSDFRGMKRPRGGRL